jgi:hypothetical protein
MYDNYRVALVDGSGQEIWTSGRLATTAVESNKVLVVLLPGKILSTGDYSFKVTGVFNSQPADSVATYYFRAVRQ